MKGGQGLSQNSRRVWGRGQWMVEKSLMGPRGGTHRCCVSACVTWGGVPLMAQGALEESQVEGGRRGRKHVVISSAGTSWALATAGHSAGRKGQGCLGPSTRITGYILGA